MDFNGPVFRNEMPGFIMYEYVCQDTVKLGNDRIFLKDKDKLESI